MIKLENEKQSIDAIKDHLKQAGETIAVAESVTSGLLQLYFSLATEASQIYQGGTTVYNIGQKYRHLQIDPIHSLSCNCVSQRIANEMALNVCNLFTSNWGIGITGYAAPVPESDNELFAFYAVAHNGKVVLQAKLTSPILQPVNVQEFYVQQIVEALLHHLKQPDAGNTSS